MNDVLKGSNIVSNEAFKKVSQDTLKMLASALIKSFGPYGSNTAIFDADAGINIYSKDGRTILNRIITNGQIESSIINEIKEITRNVDLKVGDGTTSAILLASILLNNEELINFKDIPYNTIRNLNKIAELVEEKIKLRKIEFTPEIARKIAMISTNGDEFMSDLIYETYKNQGTDVHIDVFPSNDANTKVKILDGLTLDAGYADSCMINTSNNQVILEQPYVYVFKHTVDTPEMAGYLRTIIEKNVLEPIVKGEGELRPTVIITPFLSSDQIPFIEGLYSNINQFNQDASKPPLLIITETNNRDRIWDLSKLCGCKIIQKYIDPKQLEADRESGLAPTLETVTEFYGRAQRVIADNVSTKFIRPQLMFESSTSNEVSNEYKSLIRFLEGELKHAQDNNKSITVIGKLKRRINAIKANMVELYIGGISNTDRAYYSDLVVDAIKNCRSASQYGVGHGANIEGLLALHKLNSDYLESNENVNKLINILYNSYKELVRMVYKHNDVNNQFENVLEDILNNGIAPNIVTGKYDSSVLCSIETDIEILKSVLKIVSIVLSANQFLASMPAVSNMYNDINK